LIGAKYKGKLSHFEIGVKNYGFLILMLAFVTSSYSRAKKLDFYYILENFGFDF
jgi:hypothetical protein